MQFNLSEKKCLQYLFFFGLRKIGDFTKLHVIKTPYASLTSPRTNRTNVVITEILYELSLIIKVISYHRIKTFHIPRFKSRTICSQVVSSYSLSIIKLKLSFHLYPFMYI